MTRFVSCALLIKAIKMSLNKDIVWGAFAVEICMSLLYYYAKGNYMRLKVTFMYLCTSYSIVCTVHAGNLRMLKTFFKVCKAATCSLILKMTQINFVSRH